MKFYELRILVPPGTEADEIESRARGVARGMSQRLEVLSATVHARPTEGTSDHDGTVFAVAHDDLVAQGDEHLERALYEFAGRMARIQGMPMTNFAPFGDTLSLKGDEDAIREFVSEEFGVNTGVDTDEEDDDDGDFTIVDPVDDADLNDGGH